MESSEAGKSFFLKLIEEKALAENFVVSKVTLSRDVPFNKFEVVYRNIARSLACKTGISLEHMVERWMTRIRTGGPFAKLSTPSHAGADCAG